jgi:DNA-binding SARP family transcriptional activator/tetratricopeptide (TPR) repeat protein
MAAKDVEIRLLGEIQVIRDGRTVPLPASKKTRALLAFLAATGRPHLREKLCELLWPGPDDPRAALRWSLTKVRAIVDGPNSPRIIADRDRVELDMGGVRSDLAEVRAKVASAPTALTTEELGAAAMRFRGELLEGLDLPDAYRFHEWLAAEREATRALRLSLLSTLVDRLGSEPQAALRYARERVALDPLSEAAHVAVIRLLAQLGNKRAALEQFESCTRILATELHAKPGPALLAARMMLTPSNAPAPAPENGNGKGELRAERIGSVPLLVPLPGAAHDAGDASSTIPLVGRARELAAIDRALAAPARVLFFAGDPGIGKSRLLGELAARAASRGVRVARGRAYEAERVRPYGAWIDALRSADLGPFDDVLRADLAPLLPELGAPSGASDRARLFDAVARLVTTRAPLTVILDDVQWLDEASAALLHAIARARPPGVTFACGAREGELPDNPPALRLVRALAKDGRLERLDLAPLDEEATIALARAVDPDVDVGRVRRDSAGNPLFAIEVARALAAGGPTSGEEIPASLEGIIADRLAQLSDAALEIVPWAAAFGRTFDLDALARVIGLGGAALAAGLEELERRGIVRAAQSGGDYDFVHDLIRAGAYRRLSSPRRRLVHGQIARALAQDGYRDGAAAGEVAHHASLGGERALAARAYLAAGEHALRVFAHPDATRFAGAGLEYATALPSDVRLPLHLALLRVKVLSTGLHGDRRTLATELSRVVREAHAAGLHADAASGLHSLSILQNDAGDAVGARESTLQAALVAREADSSAKARQLSDSARCLAMIEREMPRAEEMLREAGAILGPDAEATLHFSWAQGLMSRFRGRASEARALLERVLRIARAEEDHWAECETLAELVRLELERGRPSCARDLCVELAPVAEKMGEGSEGPVAEALAALAGVAGDEAEVSAEAVERLDRAIRRLHAVDAKGMLAYVLNLAASLDLARGARHSARVRATEALRAAEHVGRSTQTVIAHAMLGRVALSEGDHPAARRHLDAVRADVATPLRVSARACAAARELAAALGTPIENAGDQL